jgi:hypothetical protein
VPATGKAERTRTRHALDYSVAVHIAAPPQRVWQLLTDAAGHARWNTTLLKLEGSIALGGHGGFLGKECHEGLLVSRDGPEVWGLGVGFSTARLRRR